MKHFLLILLLFFVFSSAFGQQTELKNHCDEAEAYLRELNDMLVDFQENIRKAQNASFIQDISLYLDIAFSNFSVCQANLHYAEGHYLEMFKILEKESWIEFSKTANKAYNNCLLIENELNDILTVVNEINRLNDIVQIQQMLSSIRTATENATYYLMECYKQNISLYSLLAEKDQGKNEVK